MKKHAFASALVAAAALCAAGGAHAQSAGQVLVKLGWNKIMPKVESGALTGPTQSDTTIDIKSASALYVTAGYMLTDNLSLDFLGGLPYKHTIVGSGSTSGVGKIGSIHQVSPTLLLQYRFMQPDAMLRPYLGAGPTFAKFYKTEGSATLTATTNAGGPPTTLGGDTEWGASIQAGLTYKIDKHWFLDTSILKTWIKTQSTLSTGQHIEANLNPVSINASIGYAF